MNVRRRAFSGIAGLVTVCLSMVAFIGFLLDLAVMYQVTHSFLLTFIRFWLGPVPLTFSPIYAGFVQGFWLPML